MEKNSMGPKLHGAKTLCALTAVPTFPTLALSRVVHVFKQETPSRTQTRHQGAPSKVMALSLQRLKCCPTACRLPGTRAIMSARSSTCEIEVSWWPGPGMGTGRSLHRSHLVVGYAWEVASCVVHWNVINFPEAVLLLQEWSYFAPQKAPRIT